MKNFGILLLSIACSSLCTFGALYLSIFWGVGRGMSGTQSALLGAVVTTAGTASIFLFFRKRTLSIGLHLLSTVLLLTAFVMAAQR